MVHFSFLRYVVSVVDQWPTYVSLYPTHWSKTTQFQPLNPQLSNNNVSSINCQDLVMWEMELYRPQTAAAITQLYHWSKEIVHDESSHLHAAAIS